MSLMRLRLKRADKLEPMSQIWGSGKWVGLKRPASVAETCLLSNVTLFLKGDGRNSNWSAIGCLAKVDRKLSTLDCAG
ncbi:hypothetical protein PanWU01x14_211010 [Parasponia andersonii]|uniref:Uncharacterized protein n=1 Tax=Parasponia andersonii TaxID=3476 RepID=A0A2P5BTY3_PARAD|nr:hypothetical protein PanWU01x14_211010 [Parasponia andersonii]